MTKLKILVGVGAVLCAIVVAATPASAWFQSSTPGRTTGKSTGTGGFVLSSGALFVKCNDLKDVWTIQNGSKAQTPTKDGPHLQIKGTFEGKPFSKTQTSDCEAIISNVRFQVVPVPVNLQIRQPTKGITKGLTASVIEPVVIKVEGTGGCELTVPTEGNEELKEVSVQNEGTKGIKVTPKVSGITTTINKVCEAGGVKGGKEAKLELEAGNENSEEGVEAV